MSTHGEQRTASSTNASLQNVFQQPAEFNECNHAPHHVLIQQGSSTNLCSTAVLTRFSGMTISRSASGIPRNCFSTMLRCTGRVPVCCKRMLV